MSKKNKRKVWDRPVRVLHWSLVVTIALSWFTSSRIGPAHEYLGYGALAVGVARVVWGFSGNRYARFRHFLKPLRPTWLYAQQVAAGSAARHLGHNPLGAWMVVALLACIAALGLTGWLYTTDWLWGYGWLANLHAGLGWLLVVLIGLHVAGVLFTSWEQRENLVAAMVTGNKAEPAGKDVD